MVENNRRDVVPGKNGGWDITAPGIKRASGNDRTQADAERRAKQIVQNAGGGEVVTHGRNGRIRSKDTVAPGNDPNPPKDKEH
jgi:hypothetical protein